MKPPRVHLIEKTAKRHKSALAGALFLILAGAAGVVLASITESLAAGILSAAIFLVGIVALIVTRLKIWWNHG